MPASANLSVEGKAITQPEIALAMTRVDKRRAARDTNILELPISLGTRAVKIDLRGARDQPPAGLWSANPFKIREQQARRSWAAIGERGGFRLGQR